MFCRRVIYKIYIYLYINVFVCVCDVIIQKNYINLPSQTPDSPHSRPSYISSSSSSSSNTSFYSSSYTSSSYNQQLFVKQETLLGNLIKPTALASVKLLKRLKLNRFDKRGRNNFATNVKFYTYQVERRYTQPCL